MNDVIIYEDRIIILSGTLLNEPLDITRTVHVWSGLKVSYIHSDRCFFPTLLVKNNSTPIMTFMLHFTKLTELIVINTN